MVVIRTDDLASYDYYERYQKPGALHANQCLEARDGDSNTILRARFQLAQSQWKIDWCTDRKNRIQYNYSRVFF